MPKTPDPSGSPSSREPEASPDARLPATREVFDLFGELTARFDASGAAGLIVIAAPMVRDIERRHGHEARERCLESLRARVAEIAEERLRTDYVVCLAEPGCDEVLVLLFRSPGSAGFYRTEMPGYRQELARSLQTDGGRVLYPYLRGPLQVPTGMAVTLRNPQFGSATQLRQLIEEARGDCRHEMEASHRATRAELLAIARFSTTGSTPSTSRSSRSRAEPSTDTRPWPVVRRARGSTRRRRSSAQPRTTSSSSSSTVSAGRAACGGPSTFLPARSSS